jgi:hypothetical protein
MRSTARSRIVAEPSGLPRNSSIRVRSLNGIGEEYVTEYEYVETISDREGVRVICGRETESGVNEYAVLDEDDWQRFAIGPASRETRTRALYFADGYRAAMATRDA